MPDFTVLDNEKYATMQRELSDALAANALLIAENRRLREEIEAIKTRMNIALNNCEKIADRIISKHKS